MYCHLLIHAEIHIYILDTYRRNDKDRRRKTSLTKYLPLPLLQGFERVVQGLRVRGNWRPNITEIFSPKSYGRQRSVFLVLQGCSTAAWSPLCWARAFLTTSRPLRLQLYSTVFFCSIRRPYITFKLPRGDMDTPPRLRNFFRYMAIGMCHFRYLWNGRCDRHRAEITVMQFRGHSLPVRQSVRV